jgi:uncharacterized membrane protein
MIRCHLIRFKNDRKGAVALLTALLLPVLIGAGAFATDLGLLYLQGRTLQAVTDAAALAVLARPNRAETVVRKLLDEAGFAEATFTVTVGDHNPNGTDASNRFAPHEGGSAFRVETSVPGRFFLAKIFESAPPVITARADAAASPIVSFSVGTRLASVSPPIVNLLLEKVLGTRIDLQLVDYRGLLNAKVPLGDLLQTIAVEALGSGVADAVVGDILTRPVRLTLLVGSLESLTERQHDLVAASVLRKLSQQVAQTSTTVRLADLIDRDASLDRVRLNYPAPALQARLSVLSLINASLRQEAVGNHVQVKTDLPGLARVSLDLLLGERMQSARPLTVSSASGAVQSDQVRLQLSVSTTQLLALLGTKLTLPVEVVSAGGQARLVDVQCSNNPTDRRVRVEVVPGLARVSVGAPNQPLSTAHVNQPLDATDLVSSPLARVFGRANLISKQSTPTVLTFNGSEIGNGTIKTARTRSIVSSLVASTLRETEITVRMLGVGLALPGLGGVVAAAITPLAEPLDALVAAALAVAGVQLGEMDVRVDDLVCGHGRIVG